MKQRILLVLTLLAGCLAASADNVVTVSSASIPQGGTGTIDISLENTDVIASVQFSLTLPDGFSFVLNGEAPVAEKNATRLPNHSVSSSVDGKTATFICASIGGSNISGTSGKLLGVRIAADALLAVSSAHEASLSGITLSKEGAVKQTLDNIDFNITVSAPLAKVVLSETSATAPTASDGAVDVTVNRTIKANEWSTICLPFDMTAQQVTTAFGAGMQLKKLSSWSFEGTPTAADKITLNFTSVTTIAKNVPCLIKVTSAISSFDVDGVVIDPAANPRADGVAYYDEATDGDYTARLTGTYKAETAVPDKALFLSGNQLWYSKGSTDIKAFRGYFRFGNVVLAAYNTGSNVRVILNFDDATGIGDAARLTNSEEVNSEVFNLSGQRVDTPKKGIYVKGGKKVIMK